MGWITWEATFWAVWVLAFLVMEGYALYSAKKGDTLSEHVWWLTAKWRFLRWLVLMLLLWLIFHFLIEPNLRG